MQRAAGESGEKHHVAIIGMACRMPGASDAAAFWHNLVDGVESITTFTDQELRESGIDPQKIRSPQYVKSRGIIQGADLFDASFFGFTPREAELLDPQHRVFLECAWHALEDGGYVPGSTEARIAVYGGVGTNWHLADTSAHPDVVKFASPASVVTSNDKDYLTTRVSFKLNLTGPSVNVQCACSTSLVAVILGMNSLLSYQCDLVLAGGATVELPEKKGYLYQEGGMESPDGRCRPFDANARGTVFSRGAGVLLLKRLDEALRDRDNIYAVLLGGAINNDGGQKVGFTAPSVSGQMEATIEAIEAAGISPETLSFVEAHGTATLLGDPIEVASLAQALESYTDRKQFCALGSVKGNIGHVDVASGAAGLIKAALALKHRRLPASLNFEAPNPKIDFAATPFFVNTACRDLPRNGTPLRGLINSFGVGGTNACAVLEEPPAPQPDGRSRAENVLLLSAKTETALDTLTGAIQRHVEEHPEVDLEALAHTCQVGRRAFQHRRFVPFTGRADLLARLGDAAHRNHALCAAEGRPVVFAFPGQGNQYVGMGAGLYRSEKVFREVVDACCDQLRPVTGVDLREVLFAEGDVPGAAERLNQTYITQPALFVVDYAQAKLWMSWGIEPAAMIGHSVGEYVAACLAGVLSLEDALAAVARRGRLIQALPGGSMLAVLVPAEEVAPFLSPALAVAAMNGPRLTVVSGPTPDIADLEERLRAEKIFAKRLDTSHAFHSAMMDPVLPEIAQALAGVRLRPPAVPIASTVTGEWLTAEEATSREYWVRHVRQTVRFSDGLRTLFAQHSACIFLECGPGHSLVSAAKPHVDPQGAIRLISSMRTATDAGSDMEHQMGAAGALWAAGRAVSWSAFYGDRRPGRISLPGYPFERQRYSIDFSKKAHTSASTEAGGKKADVGEWFYVPSWKRTAGPEILATSRQRNPAPPAPPREDRGVWLLFDDGFGLADRIAAELGRAGAEVVRVQPGAEYRQVDEHRFVVRPGAADDPARMIGALKEAKRRPARVLHLWNVDDDSRPVTVEESSRATDMAFYSPLYLEQAFIQHNLLDDLRILVAVTGAFDVAGEGARQPVKALAAGPCRVLGKELAMARARLVDVARPAGPGEADALAAALIREADLATDETVIAYRRGHRFVECFDPIFLGASAEGLSSRIRKGGVYLLTGGLGGLGLFFARHLARTESVRLILTHRAPLPERSGWSQWLADHPEDDATSEKIRGVLALEEAGAEVMLARADAADLAAMTAVRNDAAQRFGRIHGVIHSAGVAGGGIISLKTGEMAAEVIDAKVRGTLVLDRLFSGEDLDFFLLFSSITSILGEAGRVDYCAANGFLDAFAHSRSRARRPVVTAINWGSWGELGMAARWEETKAARRSVAGRVRRADDGPRLALVGKDAQQEAYDVLLDPERDWTINSHLVFGNPTLVGTAFLDLLYQLAQMKRPGSTAIVENAQFVTPLMFEPGRDRRVRLFVREGSGTSRFSFRSQSFDQTDPKIGWLDHFMGEFRMGDEAGGRVDIHEVLRRFDGEVDHPRFFEVETPFLKFGERWQILQELRVGRDEWLARVELPEPFVADLKEHAFHPSMTDVSLAAAIQKATELAVYLPSGYGRFELKARYTPAVWSHIRLNSSSQRAADTVAFDISILDAEGRELAVCERYVLRKMAAPQGRAPEKPAAVPAQPPARKPLSRPKDVLPDEGLDALGRILSAPFLPQVVVCTSDLDALIDEERPGTKKSAEKAAADDPAEKTAPAYARPSLSTPYEEPANEVEKAICEIWEGILGIGQIGANDDFTELGGNSLLAVQAVANAADAFQVDLPFDSFYRKPTARGLAEAVVEVLVSMANEETLESLVESLEG